MPKTAEAKQETQALFEGREMPCPLCGAARPVHVDRRGKPYISCNNCGVQMFVRLPEGIQHLAKLARIRFEENEADDGEGKEIVRELEPDEEK